MRAHLDSEWLVRPKQIVTKSSTSAQALSVWCKGGAERTFASLIFSHSLASIECFETAPDGAADLSRSLEILSDPSELAAKLHSCLLHHSTNRLKVFLTAENSEREDRAIFRGDLVRMWSALPVKVSTESNFQRSEGVTSCPRPFAVLRNRDGRAVRNRHDP